MRSSRLAILIASTLVALVAPASASAVQSLGITSPTGFPAGGDPTYTTNISLDTSAGTASKIALSLAPGVLAAPSANPSCLKTTQDSGTACEIGTGTVTAGLALPVTAYLAPPPKKGDVVGIDIVAAGLVTTHGGGKLVQTKSGNVQTQLQLNLSSLPPVVASMLTSMSLTINGTLDNKPFNRMPTNCSPGSSSVTITYANKTETTAASPDFAPTGCSALPFSPQLTAAARPSVHGRGAGTVITTITQASGQAATAKETLMMPASALDPNLASIKWQNKHHPLGSVLAVSPLLPTPLHGLVFLKGTIAKPLVVFKFPPPAAMSLTGAVNVSTNSFTIPVVPDVPLTRLKVTFPRGPAGLLAVKCTKQPAAIKGSFVGQNGIRSTSSHAVTLRGC
jgi:hypothetical protein